MKNVICILLYFFILNNAKAQEYSHALAINGNVFTNFCNKERDKCYFPRTLLAPNITYTIQKQKWGVTANYTYNGMGYYPNLGSAPERSIISIICKNIRLACQYQIIKNRKYVFSPYIGMVYTVEDCATSDQIIYDADSSTIPYGHREKKMGICTGINVNYFIYKKIFINANINYTHFINAKYNQQNIMYDIGIGYQFLRRKEFD